MVICTDIKRGVVLLLVVALVGVAACGQDSDGDDSPAADAGVVTEQEYLGHQLRELPADRAPTVSLDVTADDHGGWNLHLSTRRFRFTPAQTGGQAHAGQGHAHVYVDGTKYSRAYSDWFFLPAGAVGAAEHTVLVTLNADDHTVWAMDGEPVTATATVSGDTHDGGHDMSTTPATPLEPAHVFEFTIAGGRASPSLERADVEQGAAVRIVVTSDQPDEIHLHGYDLNAPVAPDQPGVIELVADQSGLFELETHETGLVLLQLQVR